MDPQVDKEAGIAPEVQTPADQQITIPPKKKSWWKQLAVIAAVGLIVFLAINSVLNDAAGAQKTAAKASIREGSFEIPDSKVLEYENFRTQVARQTDDIEKRVKELSDGTLKRDAEIANLRRQLQESFALGGGIGGVESTALESELSTLPVNLRSIFPAAVEEIERLTLETGNINYTDVLPAFNPWVRARAQTATEKEIATLARAAQVRRKGLTDAQALLVTEVASRRLALGIPADNISAIAKMIWSRRASYPPMTAGQMLSLAHLAGLTTAEISGSVIMQQPGNVASPRQVATAWQQAAVNVSAVSEMLRMGPVAATTDAVRLSVKSVIPLIIERILGAPLANDSSIKGAAYAIGMSDARVTMNAGVETVHALLQKIESDIQTGMGVKLSVSVTDPRASSVGVEQMIAMRASTVGAAAAQLVLSASEPVLDLSALEGVLRSPSAEMMSVAISSDTKDGQYIYRLLDVALKRGDGRGGYPANAQVIRLMASGHQAFIEEVGRTLIAQNVAELSVEQYRRIGLVAAALPYATSAQGGDAKKQSAAAERNVVQIATWIGSSNLLQQDIAKNLIPKYANNYLTLRVDWTALTKELSDQVERMSIEAAGGSLIQGSSPEMMLSGINSIRRKALPMAEGVVNQTIVRHIVLASIAESEIGKEPIVISSVHDYIDTQIERLVVPEYTDERIRLMAGAISRDCIAILTGKRNLPRRRITQSTDEPSQTLGPTSKATNAPRQSYLSQPNTSNTEGPNGERRVAQELRVVSFGSPNPLPPGMSRPLAGPANLGTSVVTLQSGTYGEAYLYSGVELSTSLGNSKRMVLVNLSHTWRGTDSIIRMRDVKILAEASPLPGATNRLILDLKRMSFRFPSGLLVERECQGYVVDGVEGRDGIIAEYRLNLEDVAPIAVGSGFFKGLGTALENITRPNAGSSVIVNNTTTTESTSATAPAGAYAAGAVAGAADPLYQYTMRAMAAISPTIVAQNGQPVTVVLTYPVVFDGVPQTEWKAIAGDPDEGKSFR